MKRHYLLHENKRDLDIEFYKTYDEAFVFRKANALLLLASFPEQFSTFALEVAGVENAVDDKFVESLRAEVHFAEFHQFETFFAILLAPFQPLHDWLYLTTYRTEEIKEKLEAFLKSDIKKVTNQVLDNKRENKREFLRLALYGNFHPTREGWEADWEKNLDNIEWLVNRMADKYLKGDEYNAYKHGLRVMTGETFFRIFTEEPTPQLLQNSHSKDSVRFLITKDQGKDNGVRYESVHQAFVHFNPDESIVHLHFMSRMLKNIKEVRLAMLRGSAPDQLLTLPELDKQRAMQHSNRDRWDVSL